LQHGRSDKSVQNLDGKPEGKRLFRSEDNIKMHLETIGGATGLVLLRIGSSGELL
jgi:hypothetical protein